MDYTKNALGKSLIMTMATFFLRIRSHFVNSFNKISLESPKITPPEKCVSLKMPMFWEPLFLQKSTSYGSSGGSASGKMLVFRCTFFQVFTPPCSKHTPYLKISVFGALFLKKHFFIQSLP